MSNYLAPYYLKSRKERSINILKQKSTETNSSQESAQSTKKGIQQYKDEKKKLNYILKTNYIYYIRRTNLKQKHRNQQQAKEK